MRVAVTCEDDLGWLNERMLLCVIEPDRFVALTLDGDVYEEVRDTWFAAQVVTGRRQLGPRMWWLLHWKTRGRLEGLYDQCCRVSHSQCWAWLLFELEW